MKQKTLNVSSENSPFYYPTGSNPRGFYLLVSEGDEKQIKVEFTKESIGEGAGLVESWKEGKCIAGRGYLIPQSTCIKITVNQSTNVVATDEDNPIAPPSVPIKLTIISNRGL